MRRLEVECVAWRRMEEADRGGYRKVVDACGYSTIFHTPEWLDALEDAFAAGARCLLARAGGRVVGAFPYFETTGPWPGRSRHSCLRDRDMVYGGPLSAPPAAGSGEEEVLAALLDRFEGGPVTMVSTVLPPPDFPCRVLEGRGYTVASRLTASVDLSGTPEALWREVHPKTRNMISKARRTGLAVRPAEEEDILLLPEMIAAPYLRSGAPPPPPHYLLRVVRRLGPAGLARVLVAARGSRTVAAAIFLRHRDRSYYWAGGALDEGYATAASHLVQWEGIEAARAAGCSDHDMVMLSPVSAPGIARFKLRFGARVVPIQAAVRRRLAGRVLARAWRLASGAAGRQRETRAAAAGEPDWSALEEPHPALALSAGAPGRGRGR